VLLARIVAVCSSTVSAAEIGKGLHRARLAASVHPVLGLGFGGPVPPPVEMEDAGATLKFNPRLPARNEKVISRRAGPRPTLATRLPNAR
jgi:hypothetical protein